MGCTQSTKSQTINDNPVPSDVIESHSNEQQSLPCADIMHDIVMDIVENSMKTSSNDCTHTEIEVDANSVTRSNVRQRGRRRSSVVVMVSESMHSSYSEAPIGDNETNGDMDVRDIQTVTSKSRKGSMIVVVESEDKPFDFAKYVRQISNEDDSDDDEDNASDLESSVECTQRPTGRSRRRSTIVVVKPRGRPFDVATYVRQVSDEADSDDDDDDMVELKLDNEEVGDETQKISNRKSRRSSTIVYLVGSKEQAESTVASLREADIDVVIKETDDLNNVDVD
mmetsp:Transcript_24638/g.36285  ORF Transcript_24638/g.36285 Transcript_24638/m.36285 type:complete len:282 (+) Transcript_24638:54-899(+)